MKNKIITSDEWEISIILSEMISTIEDKRFEDQYKQYEDSMDKLEISIILSEMISTIEQNQFIDRLTISGETLEQYDN